MFIFSGLLFSFLSLFNLIYFIRNVELETKLSMRNSELARLESLLQKTKEEYGRQISQEVRVFDWSTHSKMMQVTNSFLSSDH